MRYFFIILFLSAFLPCASQDFSTLKYLTFNSDTEYRVYEKDVLACSDYILSVPAKEDSNRAVAVSVLIRWMRGTPDFYFQLDDWIISISKKDQYLLHIYMAAVTKFMLENREMAENPEEVSYQAYLIFLNYCANPANKVKISKKIQKAIDAKNQGILREYLEL